MDDFATLAALAALAYKLTSLVKYITAGMFKDAATTVTPWVAAFVVLLVAAQADATAAIVLPGLHSTLGSMDVASLLIAAPALGASANVINDFRSAVDNTDTAVEPRLGG